jgi:glycogen(starch) synthase
VLLPNGINTKRFEVIHEFQGLHQNNKNRLHEFTRGYFFPSYEFDLDQTLYMVNSGRFEYRNKGMDLCLDALARLNQRLKETCSPKTVVFFLITNRPVRSMSVGSLQYRSMFQELQSIAKSMASEIESELMGELTAGRTPDLNSLVTDPTRLRLRRALHAWKREWLPPIVTHDVLDDANDPVLEKLRQLNLINLEDDRVKIVYHPQFVDSTNPLLGMEYEDLIRGCHLGVFPSAYEPWGYTPLECLAMGVPAVTSNLAGFGTYAINLKNNIEKHGLYVVDRDKKPYHEAVEQLTDQLFAFSGLTRRQRVAQRNRAESLAQAFDWKQLIGHYQKAQEMALSGPAESR